MLHIDKSNFFGKGHHRECFIHPENKNLCIKIIVDGNDQSAQIMREKRYYRHLENRQISWDMLSKYYGDVATNMGLGSVFELILDHNGQVSKTLEYYLETPNITDEYYHDLSQCFIKFKEYLFSQRIITSRLEPRNIVCQKTETGIIKFSLVDNIGNSDFFPICNYSKYFARKKISRRWERFKKHLVAMYPENQSLLKLTIEKAL